MGVGQKRLHETEAVLTAALNCMRTKLGDFWAGHGLSAYELSTRPEICYQRLYV